MYRYLETLDPDSKLYLGSPSPGRHDASRGDQKTWFANGGPGYILSRGAMKALLGDHSSIMGQSITSKYSGLLRDDECCGDSVVGWVLWEAGVQLQGIWPMFTPYSANEIPYIDRVWCHPLLTLHKTVPEDMGDLFQWEFKNRKEDVSLGRGCWWRQLRTNAGYRALSCIEIRGTFINLAVNYASLIGLVVILVTSIPRKGL